MRKRERANIQIRTLVGGYMSFDNCTVSIANKIGFKSGSLYDILKVQMVNRVMYYIQDYDSKRFLYEKERNP